MIVFFLTSLFIHQSVAQLAQFNTPTCGLTQLPDNIALEALGLQEDSASARIIYGQVADQQEMPWVVRISPHSFIGPPYLEPVYSVCTGTIINNWWIITAAHCLTMPNQNNVPQFIYPGNIEIQAGSSLMASNIPGQEAHQFPIRPEVDRFFAHPDYVRVYQHQYTLVNDLALIRLRVELPVVFHAPSRRFLVNHICLPTTEPNLDAEHRMAGYGMIGNDLNINNDLMMYDAEIFDHYSCDVIYYDVVFNFTRYVIQNNQIVMPPGYGQLRHDNRLVCTVAFPSATCSGDSGGPLSYQRPDGIWELVGVGKAGRRTTQRDLNDVVRYIYTQPSNIVSGYLLNRYHEHFPCGHLSYFNVLHEYRAWIELHLEYSSPVFVGASGLIAGAALVAGGGLLAGLNYLGQEQQPQLEEPDEEQGLEEGAVGPGLMDVVPEEPERQLRPAQHYLGPGVIHYDPNTGQPGTVLPWLGYPRVAPGQQLPPVVPVGPVEQGPPNQEYLFRPRGFYRNS